MRFGVQLFGSAMPEITRRRRRRRLVALTGTIVMVAAACGSSPEATVDTAVQEPAGTSSEVGEGVSSGPEEPASSERSPDAPESSLFPNIEVVNVADSSTLNLSTELAGGDRPVLLWFWAPH